jgi:ubiquinone/menaquinone biosynthesis C-methylase UbiE
MTEDPYRRVANIYDRLFESQTSGLRLLGVRMFQPKKGMKVLDVGCGTGIHLDMYRRFNCNLYGIDTSPSMLNVARSRLGDNAELHLGEATQMPYEKDTFDLILCMLALHEMDQSTRTLVLSEIRRVLKKDGHILLVDHHTGHVRPIKGWIVRLIIILAEMAGGRRHFRNYRHFISIGGLPRLIEENQLVEKKHKVVADGNMALYLVRTE